MKFALFRSVEAGIEVHELPSQQTRFFDVLCGMVDKLKEKRQISFVQRAIHASDACIWYVHTRQKGTEDEQEYASLHSVLTMSSSRNRLVFAHGDIDLKRVLDVSVDKLEQSVLVTDAQTLNRSGFFLHTAPYAFERQVTECLDNLDNVDAFGLEALRGFAAMVIFLSTSTAMILRYEVKEDCTPTWNGLFIYAPNLYTSAKMIRDVIIENPHVFQGAMAALVRSLLDNAATDDKLNLKANPIYRLSEAVHDAILLFGMAFDTVNTFTSKPNKDSLYAADLNGQALTKAKDKAEIVLEAIRFLRDPQNTVGFNHPVHVPLLNIEGRNVRPWSMYECLCIDGFDIARLILSDGVDGVKGLPVLRRGGFFSFDQKEALSMLRIEALIKNYLKDGTIERPLSLAIFGAPGSGKSYFLKQLVQGLNKQRNEKDTPIQFHAFNLSQMSGDDKDSLNDMFQRVRDDGVKGSVPLLFLDEFDTDGYRWLRHFLAPMQDGQFIVGSSVHNLPRCILVFAGGITSSIKELKKVPGAETLKIPDFISRLHGFQTVWGVNPIDADKQRMYMTRRAVILKNQVSKRFAEIVKLDEALQYALLHISKFEHGARSIEMFCNVLTPDGSTITTSWLPSEDALELFFAPEEFWQHYKKGLQLRQNRDYFAQSLHECYHQIQERFFQENGEYLTLITGLKPWNDLDEVAKVSNQEPIWHLESRLLRNGYRLEFKGQGENVDQLPNEKLAREEHMRWACWRIMHGCRFGYANDTNNGFTSSPFLIDCATLEEIRRGKSGSESSPFLLDKTLTDRLIALFKQQFVITHCKQN